MITGGSRLSFARKEPVNNKSRRGSVTSGVLSDISVEGDVDPNEIVFNQLQAYAGFDGDVLMDPGVDLDIGRAVESGVPYELGH